MEAVSQWRPAPAAGDLSNWRKNQPWTQQQQRKPHKEAWEADYEKQLGAIRAQGLEERAEAGVGRGRKKKSGKIVFCFRKWCTFVLRLFQKASRHGISRALHAAQGRGRVSFGHQWFFFVAHWLPSGSPVACQWLPSGFPAASRSLGVAHTPQQRTLKLSLDDIQSLRRVFVYRVYVFIFSP